MKKSQSEIATLAEARPAAYLNKVRAHLIASAQATQRAATLCDEAIADASLCIVECFRSGNKVLLCGNGGSAADCQHVAAEFVSVLDRDHARPGLPAIALTTDTSYLTARANDFGFDDIFERQVETLGKAGDVLVAFSTSGNSLNVIRAAKAAGKLGMRTIAFTGEAGGELRQLSDVSIRVPSDKVQHIQETHIAAAHVICEIVEETMFEGWKH